MKLVKNGVKKIMSKIRINLYYLEDPKLTTEKTLISISDIHGNIKVLKRIKEFIDSTKVDYVCIPGDTMDHVEDQHKEKLIQELKDISRITKTIISTGNHELFRLDEKGREVTTHDYSFFDELKNTTDCIILTKQVESYQMDDGINVSAINMPHKWYHDKPHENKEDFVEFVSNHSYLVDNDLFQILLCHSPNGIIKNNKMIQENKFINQMNLILCGHNHGGLTPYFIQKLLKSHPVGLVGPYMVFLQPAAYGSWTDETLDRSLILSNGITKLSDTSKLKELATILNNIFIPEFEVIKMAPGNQHCLKLNKRIIKKYNE